MHIAQYLRPLLLSLFEVKGFNVTEMLLYRWLAPESIKSNVYNTQSDVWMFGVLACEVFNGGKVPHSETYPTDNQLTTLAKAIANENLTPSIPKSMPQWLAELVTQCLSKEPRKRPSFGDICSALDSKRSSWQEVRSSTIGIVNV